MKMILNLKEHDSDMIEIYSQDECCLLSVIRRDLLLQMINNMPNIIISGESGSDILTMEIPRTEG